MRVFEYAEMSMKFDRHTDAENVNFEVRKTTHAYMPSRHCRFEDRGFNLGYFAQTIDQILSDDWTKQVLLQNDRSIEFHAQGGIHYRTRIPKVRCR